MASATHEILHFKTNLRSIKELTSRLESLLEFHLRIKHLQNHTNTDDIRRPSVTPTNQDVIEGNAIFLYIECFV